MLEIESAADIENRRLAITVAQLPNVQLCCLRETGEINYFRFGTAMHDEVGLLNICKSFEQVSNVGIGGAPLVWVYILVGWAEKPTFSKRPSAGKLSLG